MASVIVWNDDYSVGLREIDEQHQTIIELINKLYTALAAKDSHASIEAIISELVQYTRTHFAVEESLMRVFGYPGYEEHKAIHDRIIERVHLFQAGFSEGKHRTGMDLLYFLKDWLTQHINEEDKSYSPHLTRGARKGWGRLLS